jgi:hypothetical protein
MYHGLGRRGTPLWKKNVDHTLMWPPKLLVLHILARCNYVAQVRFLKLNNKYFLHFV